MAYELLIFDFDGTLVDTAPDIAHHANVVLAEYGFATHNLNKVKKAIGRGVHDLFRDLGFQGSDSLLNEAVARFKEEYSKRPVIRTAPYPHVQKNLAGPLKFVKKAIVTNKPQGLTVQILEVVGLASFFDLVIGDGADFPKKPDPASTKFVMRTLRVLPSRTVFIGDSGIDQETAANAGIDFSHVSYGYDASFRPAAGESLKSASEWAKILKKKNKG